MEMKQIDGAGDTYTSMSIKTSNREFRHFIDYNSVQNDSEYRSCNGSILCDMDANDTAIITFHQNSGTAHHGIRFRFNGGNIKTGFRATVYGMKN